MIKKSFSILGEVFLRLEVLWSNPTLTTRLKPREAKRSYCDYKIAPAARTEVYGLICLNRNRNRSSCSLKIKHPVGWGSMNFLWFSCICSTQANGQTFSSLTFWATVGIQMHHWLSENSPVILYESEVCCTWSPKMLSHPPGNNLCFSSLAKVCWLCRNPPTACSVFLRDLTVPKDRAVNRKRRYRVPSQHSVKTSGSKGATLVSNEAVQFRPSTVSLERYLWVKREIWVNFYILGA